LIVAEAEEIAIKAYAPVLLGQAGVALPDLYAC
jgi:hypothetical protein